jgi:RNA polymerase sigma-70 factor (ECF subfamily)
MHEHDLPAALAEDRDGTFAGLVATFQDQLYAFALRLAGNPHDAEEIVADAFVRAYQALGHYPAERIRALLLRPWLYQITRNVFRNHVRGRRWHPMPHDQPGPESDMALTDEAAEQPESMVERAELREMLTAQVAALPERERVVVVLHHVQGLGYGEIAHMLEQPIGTVKANVHRGVQRLRAAMDALGEWR